MTKKLGLVFVITFVVCLTTVNIFNRYFAERALQSDAEQLLYQFHDALVDAHDVLDTLPEPNEFQCSEQTIEQMALLTYEHPAVRLLGVMHGDEQTCASKPIHMDLSDYHERVIGKTGSQLDDDLFLSTAGHGDGHLDLLMIRAHGDSRYFVSINPFMIDYLSEFACSDCLEYDFIIDGLPKLEFRSHTMKQPVFIEYKTSRIEETLDVYLFLRGTKAFYNYYKEVGWLSSIIFSFVIASLMYLFFYKLLTVRQSMERIIQDALKFDEFEPFYQPIVDSRNGEVIGAEVLARWRKKDGTIVPPYQFIPFAESSGLIVDITEQLLKKIIRDVVVLGWGKSKQFMSVNIVPEHVQSDSLYELISEQLTLRKLPAHVISIEITERMRIPDLQQARSHLDNFYKDGIKLKLDDAGTGYGGFSYIQELGISTLKIDKMFIDTIASDDFKVSVLESIIAFAKASELDMIAEGVEDENQVAYLKERDVFFIQGYVYAKPMPINELIDWLGIEKEFA